MNLSSCKWIYRIKYSRDGSIECRKARLVIRGFDQLAGLDYTETFNLVVKPTTIRIILSLAITHDWVLGNLMSRMHNSPQGFIHPDFPYHVCKMNNSLYGLK